MTIDIDANSRTFITGKTGSGKTYFAKELLKSANRLIVFDIKNNLSEPMNLVPAKRKENWRKFLRGYDIRLQVTAPVGTYNDFEFYHEWFRRAFIAADCVVYIDELLGVLRSPQDLPMWLKYLYTRGREPVYKRGRIVSGNIGIVASTQRPSHIPVFCMTESENFFIFQLQNPDDRKKVADYTSPEISAPIPDEHGFYYYKTRSNQPEYYQSLT